MDRCCRRGVHRALFVNGLAQNIEDAAEGGFTHWNADRCASIQGFHAADQAVGAAHRHSTNAVVTQQLLHFCCQSYWLTCCIGSLNAERVENLGQLAGRKFHVQNRANDLANNAIGTCGGGSSSGHRKGGV